MENLSGNLEKIENLFSKLNQHYYNGELPVPIITISPSGRKNAYGWCTVEKIWQETSESHAGYYEINLCAEHLNRPFEEVVETMLHEMAHLYNSEHGIKDTSRSSCTYHNKKFKETAEKHGLIIGQDSRYGWTVTKLNAGAKDFVKSLNAEDFTLYRLKNEKKKQQHQPRRKYVCPKCGKSFHTSQEISAICNDCNVPFHLNSKKN